MLEFQEMSEDDAVRVFLEDGYYEYKKRRERYQRISPNSSWATAPARMFVGFLEDKPVGVIGFAPYKGVLLGAGIHVRRGFRGRGLAQLLVQKLIKEKGGQTLFVNIANPRIANTYRRYGFKDMNEEELPDDSRNAIRGLEFADQVQKWVWGVHRDVWFDVVKNGIR